MSKYENAIKLLEERSGNDKEVTIGIATISLSTGAEVQPTAWFALITRTAHFIFQLTQRKIKCSKLKKQSSFCLRNGMVYG